MAGGRVARIDHLKNRDVLRNGTFSRFQALAPADEALPPGKWHFTGVRGAFPRHIRPGAAELPRVTPATPVWKRDSLRDASTLNPDGDTHTIDGHEDFG